MRRERRSAVSAVSKALYMPLQIASSVAGGLLAGEVFTEIWKRRERARPGTAGAEGPDRSGREALAAAACRAWSSVWSAPPSTGLARTVSRGHPREIRE